MEGKLPVFCHCHDFFLQALRRLVVFGFQSDSRTLEPVAVVTQTVPVLLQALQTLLAARPAKGAPRSQLAVMLDRGLIKLAKVITNVQEVHPWYGWPVGPITNTQGQQSSGITAVTAFLSLAVLSGLDTISWISLAVRLYAIPLLDCCLWLYHGKLMHTLHCSV